MLFFLGFISFYFKMIKLVRIEMSLNAEDELYKEYIDQLKNLSIQLQSSSCITSDLIFKFNYPCLILNTLTLNLSS